MRYLRWVVVACVVALVAAGCGRSDDDKASDTTTTTAASSSGSTGGSADTADFGTLKDVCQPGDAKGATAQGVTDDSIKIATFADPGFAGRPGLLQEFFDTAEVFSKWCNDHGGINGRKIVVDERDSALTEVKPRMAESCKEDFFMVGGGATFDNNGVDDRLKCLLPDVAGFVVTPEARSADLLVQPAPNPFENIAAGEFLYLGKKFPETTKHVGILTGNLPTTITVAKQQQQAIEKLGWKVVYSDQYPAAGATDWSPYVQAMKDKGVQGLLWVGEPESLAKLEQAMTNANYKLDWIRTDTNHYDRKLIDIAGSGIQPTYIPTAYVPFEDASKNPATQEYLDLFAKYKPDAKTKAQLGLQGWSAWLLFAQAAKACGSDLTRTCVYDNLKKVHSWTGGGLQAETDPGNNVGTDCFMLIKATPNGFVDVDVDANQGLFNCSPKNRVKLPGPFPASSTLQSVGQDIKNLK